MSEPAVASPQGRAGVVGPLFYYELVRLARSGRTTLLRCLYALALLVALAFAYLNTFASGDWLSTLFAPGWTLPLNALARVGEKFAESLLLVQSAAVLVLTPAYVAGAVAEERERGTLEILFTTHLSDREIVLGKLCARLVHLAGVLLTGLPVLCLVELWGGVDPGMVLAMFAVTGLTLLSVGSASIFCSAQNRTRLGALASSYLLVLFLCGCGLPCPAGYLFSPFGFLWELDRRLTEGPSVFDLLSLLPAFYPASGTPIGGGTNLPLRLTCQYAVVHGLFAFFFLRWAIAALRRHGESGSEVRPLAGHRLLFLDIQAPKSQPLSIGQLSHGLFPVAPLPPVDDRPLLWKELYAGGWSRERQEAIEGIALCMVYAGAMASVLLMASLTRPERQGHDYATYIRDAITPFVRWTTLLGGLAACLAVAFTAAASVSRERERRTLDGLLMLPCGRREILFAKWLGSVLKLRPLGYALAVIWTGGLLSGALHPLGALLLLLFIGSHIAFLASVGLWLSVTCRNALRAQVVMALVLLLVFAGPWLVLAYDPNPVFREGLNPLGAWWYAAFGWPALTQAEIPGWMGIATALSLGSLFPLAAVVFWEKACNCFRRNSAQK